MNDLLIGEMEELPRSQCPRCGVWLTDYDGFGVVAHLPENDPVSACGYCSHPSWSDGRCDCCGKEES